MAKSKKHRSLKTRQLAERYPNGHIKPERPALSVAQYRREVMAASLGAADPLLGTQLGWLARQRKITQDQLEAALRVGEIYGAYDLAMGRRRTAASPAYEVGRRATGDGAPTAISFGGHAGDSRAYGRRDRRWSACRRRG
jgi:hypothetical protein